jgi:hypothetical protein
MGYNVTIRVLEKTESEKNIIKKQLYSALCDAHQKAQAKKVQ